MLAATVRPISPLPPRQGRAGVPPAPGGSRCREPGLTLLQFVSLDELPFPRLAVRILNVGRTERQRRSGKASLDCLHDSLDASLLCRICVTAFLGPAYGRSSVMRHQFAQRGELHPRTTAAGGPGCNRSGCFAQRGELHPRTTAAGCPDATDPVASPSAANCILQPPPQADRMQPIRLPGPSESEDPAKRRCAPRSGLQALAALRSLVRPAIKSGMLIHDRPCSRSSAAIRRRHPSLTVGAADTTVWGRQNIACLPDFPNAHW